MLAYLQYAKKTIGVFCAKSYRDNQVGTEKRMGGGGARMKKQV